MSFGKKTVLFVLSFFDSWMNHFIRNRKEGAKTMADKRSQEESRYYPKRVMEEIRSRNPIADVIAEFVPVEKDHGHVSASCPFCEARNEKEKTLLISTEKNTYQCYECGASGDVFSFVMECKNVSLREAAEILADRINMELLESIPSKAGRQRREDVIKINQEAARYYFRNLTGPDKSGLDYLHNRGISNNMIKKFGIGYATQEENGLYKYLRGKGFSDKQLKDSGLITFSHGNAFDKFRSRVMCPVINTDREVLGFSGRAVAGEEPKYKNSPSTFTFDKKTILYGLNLAQHSSHSREMILCEGNMDVVSLHQAGFDNAVAPLGTAFSKEHSKLLNRYTDHVHLIFDSDEPGIKAALRAIPILREEGIQADIVHLEPYKDPDEFLRAEGPHEFQERINEVEDSMIFEIRNWYKDYDMRDDAQKAEVIKDLAQKLPGLDLTLQESYVNALKLYIDDYEQIKEGGYIRQENRTETQTDGEHELITYPEEKNTSDPTFETYVDTSWLEDYTL